MPAAADYPRVMMSLSDRRKRIEDSQDPRIRVLNRVEGDDYYDFIHEVQGVHGRYEVLIGKAPSCSCPWWQYGHYCKHMVHVLHMEYKIPYTSYIIGRWEYTESELVRIIKEPLDNIRLGDPSELAEMMKSVLQSTDSKANCTCGGLVKALSMPSKPIG